MHGAGDEFHASHFIIPLATKPQTAVHTHTDDLIIINPDYHQFQAKCSASELVCSVLDDLFAVSVVVVQSVSDSTKQVKQESQGPYLSKQRNLEVSSKRRQTVAKRYTLTSL